MKLHFSELMLGLGFTLEEVLRASADVEPGDLAEVSWDLPLSDIQTRDTKRANE